MLRGEAGAIVVRDVASSCGHEDRADRDVVLVVEEG